MDSDKNVLLLADPLQAEAAPSIADLYEDINFHHIHKFILDHSLSVKQGNTLLDLWAEVYGFVWILLSCNVLNS